MVDLERRLREGTGLDDAVIAEALGVLASDEEAFARELVAALARAPTRDEESAVVAAAPWASLDASRDLLRRLVPIGDAERPGIDRLDDEATLLAVLWGGSLRQRRAVIARLGELGAEQGGATRARIDEALASVRDEDVALDVDRARARLGDASGLTEGTHARETLSTLDRELRRFYDGELDRDPLETCDAESRSVVGSRLREASASVLAHLEALLSDDETSRTEARMAWLAAIRSAGDPRLAPTLGALLDAADPAVALDAARALARIDTDTARLLLAEAFARSSTPAERALLGGMLVLQGIERVGEVSILAELRETMRAEDPKARLHAVAAIGPIATGEDFDALAGLLGKGTLALDRELVRSIGRLGDSRALSLLRAVRSSERGESLAVEIVEASRAVRARMALRGEKPVREPKSAPLATREPSPPWARAVARWHLAVATILVALGLLGRAIQRLDRATAAAHELVEPWLAKGRIFEKRGAHAEALVVFRRALALDRGRVERTPHAMRSLARAFLRRSETSVREGRREVARGLLDEVLALDLRRVPAPLRQALLRERERIAREEPS